MTSAEAVRELLPPDRPGRAAPGPATSAAPAFAAALAATGLTVALLPAAGFAGLPFVASPAAAPGLGAALALSAAGFAAPPFAASSLSASALAVLGADGSFAEPGLVVPGFAAADAVLEEDAGLEGVLGGPSAPGALAVDDEEAGREVEAALAVGDEDAGRDAEPASAAGAHLTVVVGGAWGKRPGKSLSRQELGVMAECSTADS